MRPLLEVRPGPLSNKGGELMLRAVVAELGHDHRLAAEHWIGPYETRAELRLLQKVWIKRLGPLAGLPGTLVPGTVRRAYGLVTEPEIDGVIDAAGFAYGDQFGAARTTRAADAAERWRRDGKAVILLPQAFGPFSTEPIRTAARRLVAAADLVFARDRVSLAALDDIGATAEHVARAPDFTISVPALPSSAVAADAHGYLVPNAKVLRHLESGARDTYLDFLVACGSEIRQRNVQVRILVHESKEDAGIASDLAQRLDGAPVVSEEDPQRLKGLIAASQVVVGSRFHALVAALSQSVPVVATGWSHKYAELMADYDSPDALVALPAGREEARVAIARALDEPTRTASIERMTRSAAEQRRQTDAMWVHVREVLARTAGARRRGGSE